MHQILKRLELIKTSISIEEHEIIELQISRLSHDDLGSIINIFKRGFDQ